jgi:hypothetical protein
MWASALTERCDETVNTNEPVWAAIDKTVITTDPMCPASDETVITTETVCPASDEAQHTFTVLWVGSVMCGVCKVRRPLE